MADFAHSIRIEASAPRVREAVAKRGNEWWTTNAVISEHYCEFRFPSAGFRAGFRVVANSPTLVEWHCIDSEHPRSAGYKDRREWVGTTVKFGIEPLGENETRLNFRHAGLVESMECYGSCSNISGFYLQSLKRLAETGKGDPFAGGRPGTISEGLVAHMVPFRVRADSIAVATAAIEEFIVEIERNEPDTLMYRSYRDEKDPLSFVHYMLFKDAAAHAKHRGSDYCAEFIKTLYPCCEQKPQPVNLTLLREAALGGEI